VPEPKRREVRTPVCGEVSRSIQRAGEARAPLQDDVRREDRQHEGDGDAAGEGDRSPVAQISPEAAGRRDEKDADPIISITNTA
jgi:hypothetical protein